jgi:hypothetical protein
MEKACLRRQEGVQEYTRNYNEKERERRKINA